MEREGYGQPRFKLDAAVWSLFSALTAHILRTSSNEVNQEAANIIKIIRQSANISIPQSNPSFNRKKTVPCWSKNLLKTRQSLESAKTMYN